MSLDYFVGFGNIDKSGNGEKNYIIFFGQAIQNQSVKNKNGSKIELNNKILLHFQQLMKSDISRRFYYKFIYSDDEDDDNYSKLLFKLIEIIKKILKFIILIFF